MIFFKTVTIDEALKRMIDSFKGFEMPCEWVEIGDASGRILAQDCISNCMVPAFSRSTVDGYAVNCTDTYGAGEAIPSILNMVGRVSMGRRAEGTAGDGKAIYVPTGGMLPEGANAVVMIEHCDLMSSDILAVHKAVRNGENVVQAGDDIITGNIIVKKGTTITFKEIGVMSASGVSKVCVYKKLRFSVISTGDELILPSEELLVGKVYDINTYTLSELCKGFGGRVTASQIVKDKFDDLKTAIEECVKISDIILLSGGSSAGDKDYTHDAIIGAGGEVFVKGISVKPGKPTIAGRIGNVPVFGLPGHPVAAIIIFLELVGGFIEGITGFEKNKFKITATLTENVHSAPGKVTFQTVKLEEREGEYFASPVYGKSGHISLMTKSSGYIRISDEREGLNSGEQVKVMLL